MKKSQKGELVTFVAIALIAFFGAAVVVNSAACSKPGAPASCPK